MNGDDRSTMDSVHRCLAEARRRDVLRYLQDADDGTASAGELADHVVEQETNSPAPSREDVLISLYHVHLPMLADEGVIEFDDRTRMVRYRTEPALERILEVE